MQFNREIVEHELNNLLISYPELADDDDLRRDMIEGATDTFEYVSFLVRRIGETKAYAAGTKDYVSELRLRIDRLERCEHFYRAMITRLMEKMNFQTVALDFASVRLQAGRPKVIIVDQDLLPRGCVRVFIDPNKTVIGEKLKAGEIVPGAELGNAEPHLVVSFK